MATMIPCRRLPPLPRSSPTILLLQGRGCRRNLSTTTTTTSTSTSTRSPSARQRQQRNPASTFHQPPKPPSFQPLPRRATTASYHSYDHPPNPDDEAPSSASFSPTERALLAAALAHVPGHGFSQAALALGARDAGYLDISTNLLPEGPFSLVRWHLVSQREALAGRARELFSSSGGNGEGVRLGVGEKVEMLTWERLMGNTLVIPRWQEVCAVENQKNQTNNEWRKWRC